MVEEGRARRIVNGYLANSLFSEADQAFNSHLAKRLRESFGWLNLYVPQENPVLNDKQSYADSVAIFNGDNLYLDKAEILIVVLDGAEIDAGVAAEIGRFVALKESERSGLLQRHIYGLYSDVRQQGRNNQLKIAPLQADGIENQFFYRNLYVVGAVKKHGRILSSSDLLILQISKDLQDDTLS